jgi:hypothetical protein
MEGAETAIGAWPEKFSSVLAANENTNLVLVVLSFLPGNQLTSNTKGVSNLPSRPTGKPESLTSASLDFSQQQFIIGNSPILILSPDGAGAMATSGSEAEYSGKPKR